MYMIKIVKNIMKKILFSIIALVSAMSGYAQGGAMTIDGKDVTYEIRDSRRIGPGVTYTEYYFDNIQSNDLYYKMRALVVEIDNEKENYQSLYMANYAKNQEYHQIISQKNEFRYQKYDSQKSPIASVMADGFVSTEQGENSNNIMGEVVGGLVAEGIMHYMPASGNTHYYVDGNGCVHIGMLTCSPTVSSANAGEHRINNFNRKRSISPAGITLFANGYGMNGKFQTADTQNNRNLGTEVVVTLDNEDGIICSGVYTGKVAKVMNGSFNKFEKGQVVLASVNGEGEQWLKNLAVGDAVTINMQYYDAQNTAVELRTCSRAFLGYAVKNGVPQKMKNDYTNKGYMIDAMGLSKDGKKSFFVHLDQNGYSSDYSKGESTATVDIFNQFLSQVPGLHEAILTDGGPSAAMIIASGAVPEDVENASVSDGRPIPNAMMVYSTANVTGRNKNKVNTVDFRDYYKKMCVGDSYEPKYYFFNPGDELIDGNYYMNAADDAPGLKLTCDRGLGYISGNKYFVATSGGKGKLYCEFNGRKDEMYIEVSEYKGLRVEPDVYTGEPGGSFTARAYALLSDGTEKELPLSDVNWTTNNSKVVRSCDGGRIRLGIPGNAIVTAEYRINYTAELVISVVTAIEQVEQTAPVSVKSYADKVVITANEVSVSEMSCVLYSIDGKVIDKISVKGSELTLARRGSASPILIHLVIDGKKYIYKLI